MIGTGGGRHGAFLLVWWKPELHGCLTARRGFSAAHINYDKSPLFGGCDGRELAKDLRLDSLSEAEHIDDVLGCIREFYGTENNCMMQDRIILWKHYWLEYINAFDVLTSTLPDSVVTAFVGRQSVELGFMHLLLVRTGKPLLGHELGKLSRALQRGSSETDGDYLDYVIEFCEEYSRYVEGRHPEYFRFPDYSGNEFFAGNRLDIRWLSYNFALILLGSFIYIV